MSVEFIHNSVPHSSTKVSPFSLILGYEPRAYPPLGKTFLPTLEGHLSSLEMARKEALAAHETARQIMTERSSKGSFHGRLEIRSGWKPPISAFLIPLGNLRPKDMAHLKSLRYYLHSYTNSDSLPHGRFTMYSTLIFYPLITRLRRMVPPS
jgi:hypothetical protein